MSVFVMAGGGTGGHVIPALAVAEELRRDGHEVFFIGTRRGHEANLVPAAGFPIEWIEIGGLNRVGLLQRIRSLIQLPISTLRVLGMLGRRKPAAMFSMGGYVAGPATIAALLRRLPIVLMEPNAIPGMTNRRIGKYVSMALISFPDAARYFPEGRSRITGVPVRREFFEMAPKPPASEFTVLITGGSGGSRTLNEAARGSWPLFRESGLPVRIIHQAGRDMAAPIAKDFASAGVRGEVVPFIRDMPAAFAEADLTVCRAGASTVSELAAAGKPAILVPFPFAADDHQFKNADALARAGAARLVRDQEMNGRRLFDEVAELIRDRSELARMAARVKDFSHQDAARKAAEELKEIARAR
jgi:UDP-N-acetylglucosamine--N-acetylmuramyl-(pentapeptide) pyrophosphoryl-undecaprenol N-acetylglucosamine transferase